MSGEASAQDLFGKFAYHDTKPSNAKVSAKVFIDKFRPEDRVPKSVNEFDIPSWVPLEPSWIRRLYYWSLVETQLTMQPEGSQSFPTEPSLPPADAQAPEGSKKKKKKKESSSKASVSHMCTQCGKPALQYFYCTACQDPPWRFI